MALKVRDWVEVRSKAEILLTLDSNGCLDSMPFMPEMLRFCGQRFQVQASAHKTCDPIYTYATRSIENAVHLNTRCDGKAHGGCEMACLLFWKEAWLKPVDAPDRDVPPTAIVDAGRTCTEAHLYAATREGGGEADTAETRYVCQITRLNNFSTGISCWNIRQYVLDYWSGNASLLKMLRGGFYVLFGRAQTSPISRRFFNFMQRLTGGRPSPSINGKLPTDAPWPMAPLDLKPGDLVRVKSHEEILSTVKSSNFHRGLYFDVEMVPYCGRTFRVKTRVDRFIDEKTGLMRSLKTPAVILENVWCKGDYSTCRMFCPRAIYSWWREEWLERVNSTQLPDQGVEGHTCAMAQTTSAAPAAAEETRKAASTFSSARALA